MKFHNHIKSLSGFISTLILGVVFSLSSTQGNAALTSCDPVFGDPCFYSYGKKAQKKKHVSRASRFRRSSRKRRKSRKRSTRLTHRLVGAHVKTHCFPPKLRRLMNRIERHYGRKLTLTSGYRSARYNRRVGGAKRSQHVHCKAVDFQVRGVNKYSLARYVKTLKGVGGVGSYCNNRSIHMDVGPKRSWHWGCGKSKKRTIFAKRKNRSKRKARRSYRTASYKKRRQSRKTKGWSYDFPR